MQLDKGGVEENPQTVVFESIFFQNTFDSIVGGIEDALKTDITGDMGVIGEIEAGFSYLDFKRITEELSLNQQQQADILGCSVRTINRLKDREDGKIGTSESDKLSCYLAILKRIIIDFSMTTQDAITWLHTPQNQLPNGVAPVIYNQTSFGFIELDTFIRGIPHPLQR